MRHFYESIEGFFHCEPLYSRLAAEAQDGAVFVEVGVWKGRSAAFMGVEIANSGKRILLHAVDAFTTTHDGSGPLDPTRFAEVKRALTPVAPQVNLVGAKSAEGSKYFEDQSLDFVFLDADHSYEAVKADIAAWLPKLKPGGLLAGDDYCYPGITGVKQAVDDMLPGAVVPARFLEGVSGWWEYRKPETPPGIPAPKLSVITPLHAFGNAFILEAWRSLKAQTEQDFEWVLLENNGGRVPQGIAKDPRVRVLRGGQFAGIGGMKGYLCDHARAPLVVELDCDDVLAPRALAEVSAALAHADFCYSDFAEFHDRTHQAVTPYRADHGWTSYPVKFRGHTLAAMTAPPATPQNCRQVYWAPNHLRAWRAEAYRAVGGHDPTLEVGDDHDLIVRFLVRGKRFDHIARCLYFYRRHERNTCATRNADVQAQTQRTYERFCWELAELSGQVWMGRDTACREQMKPGEWLFLLCPARDWHDRGRIPLLRGDFHVAALYDRGFEVEAHVIRLGDGYSPMGAPSD